MRNTTRSVLGVLLALMMLTFAACGSGDDASGSAIDASSEMGDMDGMDGMDDANMDMSEMNMGDVNATPAAEVEGAELQSGEFVLLDTRPEGYDNVAGTSDIARHEDGTTVTVQLEGLIAGEDYISHLHDGPCSDLGGKHYQFDVGGSEFPPNEVHLAFVADADGSGFMTAENDMVAGPEAISLVVHPQDLLDNKIACVEYG